MNPRPPALSAKASVSRGVIAALCGLAFALLAVGQVLPALHFALVGHRVCAEHGALEHSPHVVTSGASASHAPSASADFEAAEAHEHCSVPAISPLRGTLPAREAHAVVRFSRLSLATVTPCESPQLALSVLAYAPKLAPPV
jgi:hypothetical protein